MTVRDVLWMNASAGQPDYSAADARVYGSAILGHTGTSRLLGARSGVVPGLTTALNVTHNGLTPGAVTVAVGQAWIDGTLTIGNYLVTVEVAEVFNVPAAGAVTRTDRVWVRARDAEVDGTVGTNRNGVVEYGQGDAGTGNPPAVPNHALLLAEVTVPVAGTPTVTDKRIYTARTDSIGTPVKDLTEQNAITTPYEGQCVFRRSDNVIVVYDGAAWQELPPAGPCYGEMSKGSTQSIADNTAEKITFTSQKNVGGIVDDANDQFTVPTGKAGVYRITANAEIAGNASGQRSLRIRLNVSTELAGENRGSSSSLAHRQSCTVETSLAVGDDIDFMYYQNSGGALLLQPTTTRVSIYGPIVL